MLSNLLQISAPLRSTLKRRPHHRVLDSLRVRNHIRTTIDFNFLWARCLTGVMRRGIPSVIPPAFACSIIGLCTEDVLSKILQPLQLVLLLRSQPQERASQATWVASSLCCC